MDSTLLEEVCKGVKSPLTPRFFGLCCYVTAYIDLHTCLSRLYVKVKPGTQTLIQIKFSFNRFLCITALTYNLEFISSTIPGIS